MPYPRPFGNSFLVDTPAIDQLHATLYNEQKNRDLQRQREVAALDDEFTKNVANIKDADVDELTAAYNDYKQSNQQLMRQKGGANPQQQLALLRKKAAMYKLINESKQEKEDIKLLGKAITSDTKGIYDTAAAARLAARLKTPTSKYGSYTEIGADGKPVPVDLRDANGYLYKLGASDFSKDFDAARGKDRDLTPDDKMVDPDDKLNFVQKQYKGKNNAIEFYTNLLPRIAGSKESKDFVLRTDIDYPPEKAAALEARYKQLVNDPAYRRKYGLKDNDEIPLSSYDSPVARAVRLRAMEHAVNSPIIEKVEKIIPNKSAVMDRRENFSKYMEGVRQGNRISLALLRREFQVLDQEAQDKYLGDVVDGFKTAGKIDPKVVDDYEKTDGKGHKVPIDEQKFNADGTVDLIVYKQDKKGNLTTEIDETYTTKGVPLTQIKAKTRKVIETPMTNTGTNKPKATTTTKKKISW